MKKVLSAVLAISMIFSLFCISGSAATSFNVTATVGSVMGASAGSEVRLPVTLSQFDNGYAAVQLSSVTYDSSVLQFVEYANGDDFSGSLRASGPNGFGMIAAPTSATAAAKIDGGVLVYLVFNALADVKTPTTVSVSFSRFNVYTNGSSDNWVATTPATVSVVSGGVDADTVKPTGSISSTNNVAASQTVTLTMSDDYALAGYYWGTSSTYSSNTYTATTATSATKTVSSAGTYYLFVKDTFDNVSSAYSITFYKTTLNANGGSVSPTAVITQKGKSFTIPTPTRTDYIFKGWATSTSATTGVNSLTVNSSATYYAIWSDAKIKAAEVDALITAIGTVTFDSESKITAARDAYTALSTEAKGYVTKLGTLTAAETRLVELKANKAAADEVIAKIDSIGTVTLESEEMIVDARSDYSSLNEEAQSFVSNLSVLVEAENRLYTLKQAKANAEAVDAQIESIGTVTIDREADIIAAREAYNSLNDDELVFVTKLPVLEAAEARLATLKQAKADAEAVDTLIEAIGTVTLDSEADIIAAREAFDALNDDALAFVTKEALLVAAEEALAKIKADIAAAKVVDDMIVAVGDVKLSTETEIVAAREAYDALTEEQKAYVENLNILEEKEYELYILKNLGDIDGSGSLDTQDALTILQHTVGKITIDDDKTILADVDGDDEISSLDALLVLQVVVGKIDKLPIVE